MVAVTRPGGLFDSCLAKARRLHARDPGLQSLLHHLPYALHSGQAVGEEHRGGRCTADRTRPALVHPASGAQRRCGGTMGTRRGPDPSAQGQPGGRLRATVGARFDREGLPASAPYVPARMAVRRGRDGRLGSPNSAAGSKVTWRSRGSKATERQPCDEREFTGRPASELADVFAVLRAVERPRAGPWHRAAGDSGQGVSRTGTLTGGEDGQHQPTNALYDRAGWRLVAMYPCGKRGDGLATYLYAAPPGHPRP